MIFSKIMKEKIMKHLRGVLDIPTSFFEKFEKRKVA